MVVINQLLGNVRPPMTSPSVPPRVRAIISACWEQEAKRRPRAETVACILSDMRAAVPLPRAGSGGPLPA